MKKLWNKVVACILVAAMGVVPVLSYADSMTNADVAELDSYSQEVDTSKISGDVVDPVDDSKVTVSYEEEAAEEETSDAAVDAVDEAALLDAWDALKDIACQDLVDGFIHLDLYEDYENYEDSNYEPTVGDVVFFGEEDADSFGILKEIDGDALTVLESDDSGDATDSTYDFTEADVIGFGVLSDANDIEDVIESIAEDANAAEDNAAVAEDVETANDEEEAAAGKEMEEAETLESAGASGEADAACDTETSEETDMSTLEEEDASASDTGCIDACTVINDVFTNIYDEEYGIRPYASDVAFAVYCNTDSSLTFYTDSSVPDVDDTYKGKTVSNVYTGFDNTDFESSSDVPWWASKSAVETVVIDASFQNAKPISLAFWFYNMGVESFTGLENIDTSEVTSLHQTFNRCQYLTSLEGLEKWDTSNVTDLTAAFQVCSQISNVDALAEWDTSSVTSLYLTFGDCDALTNVDGLADWDTSSVTDMKSIFMQCRALSDIMGLKEWDTSNVTTLHQAFDYCDSLLSVDALAGWDISSVTDMEYTFCDCRSLTDVNGLATWNTENVTTLLAAFETCYVLTDFSGLANWNTGNVELLNFTFENCYGLESVEDIANWNTSAVRAFQETFRNCSSLTDVTGLANWETTSATAMSGAFRNCSALTDVSAIANWDTTKSDAMDYMFSGCSKLEVLDVSNWNPESARTLQRMFMDCSSLTTLDVSNWDTSRVTNMTGMFYGCTALTTIYSNDKKFVTSAVTSSTNMFSGCTSLVGGMGTKFDSSNITAGMAHVDDTDDDNPGYFTGPVLSVTMTADKDTYNVGNTITYTITVTNKVNVVTADDVVVSDVLPSGLTNITCTSSIGSASVSGNTITANVGSLAYGDTITITVQATVGSSLSGKKVTNTASAEADNAIKKESDSVTVDIDESVPTLSVTKTADSDTYKVGDTITYTIEVKQTAEGVTADDLVITDVLPDGLTIVGDPVISGAWVYEKSGTLEFEASTEVQQEDHDAYFYYDMDGYYPYSKFEVTGFELLSLSGSSGKDLDVDNYKIRSDAWFNRNANTGKVNCEVDVVANTNEYSFDADTLTGTFRVTYDQYTSNVHATVDGNTVTATVGNLDYGDTITITVQATVGNSLAGKEVTNTASVEADNAEGVDGSVTVTIEDNPTPVLSVTKTSDKENYYVGETVTYTITVKQMTPDATATNVVISDEILNGLEETSSRLSGVDGRITSGDSEWVTAEIPSLAYGETAILEITATVLSSAYSKGQINNIVNVSADDAENVSANVLIYIIDTQPQLSITKTADKSTYTVGDTVTYTITVIQTVRAESSDVNLAATNVVINDAIPAGLTVTNWSLSGVSGTVDQSAGRVYISSLPYGQTAALTITATVGESAKGTTIVNTASALADGIDSISDSASIRVANDPALSITKTADKASYGINDTVTYTITVAQTEEGATAQNVVITDAVPSGLTVTGWTCTGVTGTVDQNAGTVTIASLEYGQTATVTITATVNPSAAGTTIYNTAQVSADGVSSVESTTVSVSITRPDAVLAIEKTADPATCSVGDTVTYTINVSQTVEYAIADSVTITDTLPDGLELLTATSTAGTPTIANNGFALTVSDLTTSDIVTVTVTAKAVTSGTITNTAYAETNGNTVSNTAIITVLQPNLSITKTANPTTYDVGDTVTYTITVTQTVNGASAYDVVVTDPLPAGLTISGTPTVTGVSGATVSASGNTVTADIGTMAYNDTAVITVAAVVGTSLAGTSVSNTATATDDAGNSESATATVEPNRYDFDLKSVDASDQILGGSEFAMYDSAGNIVYFTVSGSTYTVCDASAAGATTTIAAGSVIFQGLLKDTYTITETQAPAGYLILTDEVTFSIDKDGISYVDGPAKAEDSRTLDIIHSKMALQMPSAGGVNSLLGVLIGCGVIGAGTAACVSSRRRKKVKQ